MLDKLKDSGWASLDGDSVLPLPKLEPGRSGTNSSRKLLVWEKKKKKKKVSVPSQDEFVEYTIDNTKMQWVIALIFGDIEMLLVQWTAISNSLPWRNA